MNTEYQWHLIQCFTQNFVLLSCCQILCERVIHTQLYSPSKAATIKKTNKTKKKKRNKPFQDKSNTTGQRNSILGLIFSTQSTNDIAVLLCLTFLAMVYFASFSLFFCYLLLLPLMANTVVYNEISIVVNRSVIDLEHICDTTRPAGHCD